jgi:hypothetical protein
MKKNNIQDVDYLIPSFLYNNQIIMYQQDFYKKKMTAFLSSKYMFHFYTTKENDKT